MKNFNLSTNELTPTISKNNIAELNSTKNTYDLLSIEDRRISRKSIPSARSLKIVTVL